MFIARYIVVATLSFMAAPNQDATTLEVGVGHQFTHQSRLANAPSPTVAATRPWPPIASARTARSRASSASRPMSGVSVATLRGGRRRVASGSESPGLILFGVAAREGRRR